MAKLAVVFFVALAFQAVFAGVHRRHHHEREGREYGQLEGYKTGQLESLVGQLQTVSHNLGVSLQAPLPANRQVTKTLTWQSREFAQYVDAIIDRLRTEVNNYSGNVNVVLKQVLGELREIQISLQQVAAYTDVSNVSQLKNQFNTNVQNAAEQMQKLVRLAQTSMEETQGSLPTMVKSMLVDFLNVIQKTQTQVQYIGVQGWQTPRQLAAQIQEVTTGLTGSLQGIYLNTQQVKQAFRECVQNIEAIISRLQEVEGTIGGIEMDTDIQQMYNKLRRVLVPLMQITDAGIVENVDVVKSQLIRELQTVAEEIQQFVQYAQSGSQQSLVQEVLGDYLSALQQVRMQIQGGYQRGLYGQTGYQGGLLGKNWYQNQLSAKSGYQEGPMSQDGLYKYGLLGQTGYQGGVWGKYQGLAKYGQSSTKLPMQIQGVVTDLSQSLQALYLDNALVRKTLINQIREYAQELEMIVERLQQAVSYKSGIYAPQQVAQNLRQIVAALQQICTTGSTISAAELRNQLNLCVRNAGNELEQLYSGVQSEIQQTAMMQNVLVQFLTATRNLQIRIMNISQVAQRSQTYTGFGNQIQTLTNGLTASIESVSTDNKQARQALVAQSQELAQQMENIIEKLQGYTRYAPEYGMEIPQQVVQNLRQTVVALRQIAGYVDTTSGQQLKSQFIVHIQNAAAEIQKLLSIVQEYPQGQGKLYFQGQGQGQVNTVLYGILNDFVAALQNQQIQLQNIYQTTQYGQGTQQLAIEIQTITNNLAIFLQNVPSNDEQIKQNLEIQARKLAQYIESIIDRLKIEVTYTNEKDINVLQQVVYSLKQITPSLQQVTDLETSSSVYGLAYQLNVVFQNVASEMRKLAWIAQSDMYQAQGNLNTVVRSILMQYMVVLQHVQIELQGINQTVQIGQTPRELALQIQVVAQRLSEIFRAVVPDDQQIQTRLTWQARCLSQIIENILNRLQVQISVEQGNVVVLRQVAENLNQILLVLQQAQSSVGVMITEQLKTQLAISVQDAAIEIQKLMWATQSDVQEGQGNVNIVIKGLLMDFLAGLQNLQMQIQTNLQIVRGGQQPRALAMQIESVANRLFAFLQWAQLQPNSQQFRQTLVIQIGELAQTIENLVQMIQTEIKNNGENTVMLQQIVAQLTKYSLSLQQLNGAEVEITVNELSAQLAVYLQNVMSEMQRLAYIAQTQVQQTLVVKSNGVLQSVFNHFLATLRTMLIQVQNTQQYGQYGQSIKELANQIQTVTTKLTSSLQITAPGTKEVRQAVAIQTLKYARRIQNVAERLETEVSYNSGMNFNTLQQVAVNLRQIVLTLQQIGGSLTTKTTVEIMNQLDNQVQIAGAEIQKLLLTQSTLQQYQGVVNTVVKSVLIEYLAAVQNLQIQVQFISQASQKGLTLPRLAIYIEAVINELSASLQRVAPDNKLVAQTITTEARQLAQVIANIINKLQSESMTAVGKNDLLQRVASQLKEIQLSLQQIAGVSTIVNVLQQKNQLETSVQRAIVAIEELVWAAQPELQQTQINAGIVSVVREVLKDFLSAVQNVRIQILNVIQNGQTDQYSWGLPFQGQQIRGPGYQGQMYGGLGLYDESRQYIYGQYAPEGELSGRQYYGGKYYAGLEDGLTTQTPRQLVDEIKVVAQGLSATLQNSMLNNQQILCMQARQLAQIIKTIVMQLEGRPDNIVVQQIVNRLREVQMSLQQLAAYNTFTNIRQIRTELENYIQIAVAQIERLVLIAQKQTQGNYYVVIKNVLNIFRNGLQNIYYQIQDDAQRGLGMRYGKGYEYGQGDSYDKYSQEYSKYGQGIGYGKYGQEYGLGKNGQGYGYGKYGQEYGSGKYGQGIGYGKYGQEYGSGKYGQGYGYGKYGQEYGSGKYRQGYGLGKYGQEYGLQGGKYQYGLQGKTLEELASQIQIVTNQVADDLQAVAVNDKQIRQELIIKARQLIQVMDNIIDRLQIEVTYGKISTVQQVCSNLKQIRMQLQQTVSSGVITTIYQMKAQIVNYVRNIASELQQLAVVAQSDVQQVQIVKQIFTQYVAYLRNVQYQLQSGLGYQTIYELVSQLQVIANGLAGSLRNTPYNTIQTREYAQKIEDIISRLQPQLYGIKEQEYLPLKQVLYKLAHIADLIQQGSYPGTTQYNVSLGSYVQEAVDELQNWMRIAAQPQAGLGFQRSWSTMTMAPRGDFLGYSQNFPYTIRAY